MAIITPETKGVNLDQRRSSAITPADTYTRPPVVDEMPLKNAHEFARAAEQLGTNLLDAATQYQQQKDKHDLERVDDTVASIRSEIGSGFPQKVQEHPLLADMSTTARMRVNEAIGHQDSQDRLGQYNEQFMQSDAWMDPAKTREFIAAREKEAADLAAGHPGYGGAYYKGVVNGLNALEQHAQAKRASYYQEQQANGFLAEVINGTNAAYDEHSGNDMRTVTTPVVGPDGKVRNQSTVVNNATIGDTTGSGAVNSVVNRIIGHESGGNPTAQNPNSSAGGLGQFIDGTWLKTVRRYAPELAGKSDGAILSMKKDNSPAGIEFQRRMVTEFTKQNAELVANTGAPVTPGNIYLMHFAGEEGGKRILRSSDGTRIEQILDDGAINANPFLRGKTVGEVKQWAATTMGGKVNPNLAAQNAIRSIDREWGQSSGIGNTYRRDVLAKGLADYAMKTGRADVLDRMPPEWMTPSIEADFAHARKTAMDVDWSRNQRQRELERQEKIKTVEDLKSKIDEKIISGQELDMGVDTRGPDGKILPEVFDYAKTHQATDLNIPSLESDTNRANLEDKIENASAAGDYSKLNPEWKGKTPDPSELRSWIDKDTTMRTQDKIALKKKLDKIIAVGQIADAPDSKSMFKYRVNTYAETMANTMMPKLMNGLSANPVDFKGEAKSFFDNEVKMRYKEAMEANGGNPPANRREILEQAAEATKTHLKDIAETISKGQTGETSSSKPAEKPKAEETTIKFDALPPNTPIKNMGGKRMVKIVNGNNIIWKEVTD